MKHEYISAACVHDEHAACDGECQYCETPCRCRCHGSLQTGSDPDRAPWVDSEDD